MLTTPYSAYLSRLFVGRKEELQLLNVLWQETVVRQGEHFVYTLLNAPGTGKTRLLQQFGEHLEQIGNGLMFFYRCDSRYFSSNELNADLVRELKELIMRRYEYIRSCIMNLQDASMQSMRQQDLDHLLENINRVLTSKNDKENSVPLATVVDFIKILSNIIPLFFVADEIQEFQKVKLKVTVEDSPSRQVAEETALHYFTRILKGLMHSPILIVLSGTQYHILSQIGFKIGSPIAQKVKQVLITNFKDEEINMYVERIRQDVIKSMLLKSSGSEQRQDQHQHVDVLLDHYHQFLRAFSGGHPRTIAFITEYFLAFFNDLRGYKSRLSYEEFVEFLFPKIEEHFGSQLFSSVKMVHLQELQRSEQFNVVKDWIVLRAHNGLELGSPPRGQNQFEQEEINNVVFQLMTIGVIVQNGSGRYHLTSYFHLLAFLDSFTDDHVVFLRKVLHDRLFKITCGGHAGFGYTFEHVLLSYLWLHAQLPKRLSPVRFKDGHILWDEIGLPFTLEKIKSIIELRGEIDWPEMKIQKDVLYHAPRARAVDMFIKTEIGLILIQVTTAMNPSLKKIKELSRLIKKVRSIKKQDRVLGWFISLFPVQREGIVSNLFQDIIVTDGKNLMSLLSESLYNRLVEVKQSLVTTDTS